LRKNSDFSRVYQVKQLVINYYLFKKELMEILAKNVTKIDKNLLFSIKGFLSDTHFSDNQVLMLNDLKRTVFRTYQIKIKYYYKHKIVRIEYGSGFITSEKDVLSFFRKVGFLSKTDFVLEYSSKMVLCDKHTLLSVNLVAFVKFNEFLMIFED
jgi:hypothetical protein